MTTAVRDQIISLIGSGVSQTVAASAAGVTDSYVSQLLQEPGVAEEIALKRALLVQEAIEQDTHLENAEKKALNKVVSMIPMARSLGEATKAFQVLNAAKRKSESGLIGNETAGAQHVTIVMPKAASVMIQMNAQQQIVEVGGKSIAPMPSKLLPALAARVGMELPHSEIKEVSPLPAARTHIAEQRARELEKDKEKALSVYDDIVTVIDGVQCVL